LGLRLVLFVAIGSVMNPVLEELQLTPRLEALAGVIVDWRLRL
jgi:hypothetical protein